MSTGRYSEGERIVPQRLRLSFLARVAAAAALVVLLSGCWDRLAQRHGYFAPSFIPTSGLHDSRDAKTERLMRYHQALQAGRRECVEKLSPNELSGAIKAESPAPSVTHTRETQARLCSTAAATHAAHGGALNSYRRWVEDRVRELPKPADTASSIGDN